MSCQTSCCGVRQTLLILLMFVSCTIAQNNTEGDQGVQSVCALSSDQSATIVTTEVNYENKFLMTASISTLEYNSRFSNPDDKLFKNTASAFEIEIVNQLLPLIQKPPPSSFRVLLDASVIQMKRTPTPMGQSTGTTLECILSTNDDLVTATFLSSQLRTVAIRSSMYPGFVSSVSSSVNYCLRELILTQFGTLTWPVTLVGTDTGTEEQCPVGTKYVGERSLGLRSCSRSPAAPGHAQWEPYICLDCGKIIQVDDALLAIFNEILQNGSVVWDGVVRAGLVLNEVEDITEAGFNSVALILEYVAKLNVISTQLLDAILRLLSNLLQQDSLTFRLAEEQFSTSTRIIQSLRAILASTALTGSAIEYVSVHQNLAASLLDTQQSQIQDEWISFGSLVGPIVDAPLTEGSVGLFTSRTLVLSPNSEAYVHIKVEGPVITDSTTVRTMFVVYHNGKLFQSVNAVVTSASTINGRVVTADIRATQSPQVAVITRFKPLDPQVTNVECRSWDQSLNNGHGDWSALTCMLNNTETTDRVKCQCDQLAAFTIFADSNDSGSAGSNGVNAIVRVGAVICIICLLAAAILFLIFEEFRSRRELQILCCLFLTLATFYLILTAGVDQTGTGCIIVGALLHYCLLAAVGWMGIAWVHLYDLSRRKPWVITWFMVKVSGVVWGFPLLFVIITVAVNPNHYITPAQRCFLSSDPIYNLIMTVILPILAMLIAMGVAFGFTARNVILDDEAKPNFEEEEVEKEEGAKAASKFWKMWKYYILYSTAIAMIVLTFVFFIIMVNSSSDGAEYIFGFLAIIKGILIIVIFCIHHRGVRETIKIKLGYINGPNSTKFQPYWSASKWKSRQGVLPEMPEEDNSKKLYLDNTQASGTLTNQRFDPNSVPLSSMEMQRMGQNGVSAHVNNGMVIEADYHTPPADADASV